MIQFLPSLLNFHGLECTVLLTSSFRATTWTSSTWLASVCSSCISHNVAVTHRLYSQTQTQHLVCAYSAMAYNHTKQLEPTCTTNLNCLHAVRNPTLYHCGD